MFQMSGFRPMQLPQGISLGYHPQFQQIGSPLNALNLQSRMQLPQSMLAAPQPVMQQTRPMTPQQPNPYDMARQWSNRR